MKRTKERRKQHTQRSEKGMRAAAARERTQDGDEGREKGEERERERQVSNRGRDVRQIRMGCGTASHRSLRKVDRRPQDADALVQLETVSSCRAKKARERDERREKEDRERERGTVE